MTQNLVLSSLLILALFGGGLASAHPRVALGDSTAEPAVADTTAVRELLQADRDFAAAVRERGVEAWVSYFSPKGAMVRGTGEVTGQAAIREAMTPLLSNATRRLVWEPRRAEAALGGDLGYTIGDYRVEATSSPDSVLSRGKYLTVWRRQPDGSWKVEADIGAPAP